LSVLIVECGDIGSQTNADFVSDTKKTKSCCVSYCYKKEDATRLIQEELY
jgi:hypothetical protein